LTIHHEAATFPHADSLEDVLVDVIFQLVLQILHVAPDICGALGRVVIANFLFGHVLGDSEIVLLFNILLLFIDIPE
jgi:hypothetical protein